MPRLFGEKLRYLRHRNGLTQSELAQRVGLASHTHIAKLEANQDVPSLALVIRLATCLGVTSDYLLRDTIPTSEVSVAGRTLLTNPSAQSFRFGEKLRVLRREHGLTQAELARQLGLARQGHVSNLEIGIKLPSLDLVLQIADLFGVTTDYLLPEAPEVMENGGVD